MIHQKQYFVTADDETPKIMLYFHSIIETSRQPTEVDFPGFEVLPNCDLQ